MSYDEINLDSKAVEKLQEVVGGGGATYTAGNGIEITNENVINADTKVIVYNGDITSIPRRTLESLNFGDAINYRGSYYVVSTKTDLDIKLTSVTPVNIVVYAYHKNGEHYKYSYMEEAQLPVYVDPAYLNADEGEIDGLNYDKIEYFGYCDTEYGMAISIGLDEEKDTIKLSTVVQDNKYYTVSFTFNEPESEEEEESYSYVITEHTLGGGSGIQYIQLTFELVDDVLTATLTQEQVTSLLDNAFIEADVNGDIMIFYPKGIGLDYGAFPNVLEKLGGGIDLEFNRIRIEETEDGATAYLEQYYVETTSGGVTPPQE